MFSVQFILCADHYGGTYAGENTADYLFSDDTLTKDTRRYVQAR